MKYRELGYLLFIFSILLPLLVIILFNIQLTAFLVNFFGSLTMLGIAAAIILIEDYNEN